MNILTEAERNAIEDECEMMIGKPAFDAIESAVIAKLSAGVSVEPCYQTASNGRLLTYPGNVDCTGRLLFLYDIDQLQTATAAARVQENERIKNLNFHSVLRGTGYVTNGQASDCEDAIRALIGGETK